VDFHGARNPFPRVVTFWLSHLLKPSAGQEETLSANYDAVSSLFTLCSAFEAALYPFSHIVVTADEQLFTSKHARLPLRAEEIVCGVCQHFELEHQRIECICELNS